MIAGRTFPNQKVTPTAHGALFAGMLSDGILKGCTISYSGKDITIATGFFILAGREIEIQSNETVTVSGSSGYARVKARIDTSAASESESFEQFSWVVDYASSVGGFTALTQTDINGGSGTIYEAEMCIVSLGTAITGIASQMGQATPANLPTKVSEFTNDAGYLTKVPSGYVKSVNDTVPDSSGNVAIDIPQGTVTSINGTLPDADGNIDLQEGCVAVELWQNSNPTTAFSEQTIQLTKGYKLYVIYAVTSLDSNACATVATIPGWSGQLISRHTGDGSASIIGYRPFQSADGAIKFLSGYAFVTGNAPATANTVMIPRSIYGIK